MHERSVRRRSAFRRGNVSIWAIVRLQDLLGVIRHRVVTIVQSAKP
ncbi:unnamed protein product [Brassica rapa subsp. trilocularis]